MSSNAICGGMLEFGALVTNVALREAFSTVLSKMEAKLLAIPSDLLREQSTRVHSHSKEIAPSVVRLKLRHREACVQADCCNS